MASYINSADAEALLSGQAPSVRTAWDTASTADRDAALSTASLLIDQEFNFLGYAATETQELAWPRKGVQYMEPIRGDFVTVQDTEIPDRVKLATALLAAHILRYGDHIFGYDPDSMSVGLSEISVSLLPRKVPRIPHIIRRLLGPLSVDGSVANRWFMVN